MASGGTGIFGGSFNPVHVGHLRLAIEAREQLRLSGVLFVPAAVPPHKSREGMLSFALRCQLLLAAVSGMEGCAVNAIEGEREGPSYSVETVRLLQERRPRTKFLFLLGASDFLTLPTWHRWQELYSRVDFGVACDPDRDEEIASFVRRYACNGRVTRTEERVWSVGGKRFVRLFSIPRLEISATMLRERWLTGRSMAHLMPEAALSLLSDNAGEVRQAWEEKPDDAHAG